MGAIKDLVPSTTQANADTTSLLETLTALAETKADAFKGTIMTSLLGAGSGADRTVPITSITDSTYETHAYTSSSASTLATSIESSVTDFVNGGQASVLSGVSNILNVAITGLFGDSSGNEQTIQKYFVATEGIALIRMDFMGWKRSVTCSQFSDSASQVSAFVMTKATIDVQKLDFDTFLDTYQNLLVEATPPLTADQIEAEIADVTKIYDAYRQAPSPS